MTDRRLSAVLIGLAAHRATRLVTKDVLTAPVRNRIVAWSYHRRRQWLDAEPLGSWSEEAEGDPDAPKLATLITCRWCASVHVTALLLVLIALSPKLGRTVVYVLAGSTVATLLAGLEKD